MLPGRYDDDATAAIRPRSDGSAQRTTRPRRRRLQPAQVHRRDVSVRQPRQPAGQPPTTPPLHYAPSDRDQPARHTTPMRPRTTHHAAAACNATRPRIDHGLAVAQQAGGSAYVAGFSSRAMMVSRRRVVMRHPAPASGRDQAVTAQAGEKNALRIAHRNSSRRSRRTPARIGLTDIRCAPGTGKSRWREETSSGVRRSHSSCRQGR
jgi:hypothetical protein